MKKLVYYPKAGLLAFARLLYRNRESGAGVIWRCAFWQVNSLSLFTPPPLSFSGARQVNFDPQAGETVYELEFSLPVSPQRLRGYLDVTDKGGARLIIRWWALLCRGKCVWRCVPLKMSLPCA